MVTTVEPANQTARAEIENRLTRLLDAWRRRNEAEIRTFFADRSDLALWGTDDFEHLVGKQDADRLFKTWIATCPPWVSIASTHRIIGLRDGVAWIADEVEGRWVDGETSGVAHLRMTSVWEESGGTWSIVHVNLAEPR